jgi:hypothetical protein
MQHAITLPENKYKQIEAGERFLFTKRLPIYGEGDQFSVTLEGHREQMQFKIARIDTAKVFKNYCILVLTDIQVDDLPESVGGGLSKGNRDYEV